MSTFTPSGDKLIILLNETFNPPKLFSDQRISFGVPVAVEDASDYNTVVDASAIPGMGYYGDAEIHYTRVDLSRIGNVTIRSLNPFTLEYIVSVLNAQFNAFLDVKDLQPVTIPDVPVGGAVSLVLTADSASLGWIGQVSVSLSHDKPTLDSVINPKALSVQQSNLPSDGHLNAVALMYNVDFTSYRDALRLKQGIDAGLPIWGFTDYPAIADVCKRIGIPGIPNAAWNAQLRDVATNQHPMANPKFDRVVVMDYVQGGIYFPGPLLFHYNLLENR